MFSNPPVNNRLQTVRQILVSAKYWKLKRNKRRYLLNVDDIYKYSGDRSLTIRGIYIHRADLLTSKILNEEHINTKKKHNEHQIN